MQPNDMVGLYNSDGIRVGTYCESTGRAQLGHMFYVPERTCEIEFDFPQEVGFKQIDCHCSECWHGMSVHDHYCAECGAKVVEQ